LLRPRGKAVHNHAHTWNHIRIATKQLHNAGFGRCENILVPLADIAGVKLVKRHTSFFKSIPDPPLLLTRVSKTRQNTT
jgi:hypothetical protein